MADKQNRRVTVLYNTDYDDELIAAVDVSAVRESAQAITSAVADYGLNSELVGVHGRDLDVVVAKLRDQPPDLVFNLCESLNGDARNEIVVPAILDMLKLPYTGTGALNLGLCLHKEQAKAVLEAQCISTPAYCVLHAPDHLDDAALEQLDYPYFLKLAHEDASVGIEASNRVNDAGALRARASALFERYNQPVVAERYVDGREVNVTVIGNESSPRGIEILPLHEIDFAAMPEGRPHIVSYAAKWDEDHIDYAGTKPVPMKNLTPALEAAIRDTAIGAYSALGLRDFGRVDLRIDGDGVPWVIDVNPNCDLSPDAGVARAAAYAGITYPALIGRICELAWSRHEHSQNRPS